MSVERYSECESCCNREFDRRQCDTCVNGSNFEPFEPFEDNGDDDGPVEMTIGEFKAWLIREAA